MQLDLFAILFRLATIRRYQNTLKLDLQPCDTFLGTLQHEEYSVSLKVKASGLLRILGNGEPVASFLTQYASSSLSPDDSFALDGSIFGSGPRQIFRFQNHLSSREYDPQKKKMV